MARGNQPDFNLAFTAKDGREYVKGPSVGLWDADKGPKARGSIKGEYLEKLIDFLKDFEDESVSVALFKNDSEGSSRRGGRDRDEDRHSDRDRDEREERGSRRSRDDDDDDDTSNRGSRRSRDDDDGDEFGKDRESRRSSSRRESSERSSSKRKSAPKKTTRKKGRK